MEMSSDVRERPDVSAEERASHELVKRILKLRWMGMNNEAGQVRVALQRAAARLTLLAQPRDTNERRRADCSK